MTPHLKADPAQQAWLFEAEKKFSKEHQPNPCVRLYGPDAAGRQCKDCRLLLRKILRSGRTFFKCGLVGDTNGPGTDFRAGWDACARFVPRQQRERKTAGNKIMWCG
jgi:hypothetical protein